MSILSRITQSKITVFNPVVLKPTQPKSTTSTVAKTDQFSSTIPKDEDYEKIFQWVEQVTDKPIAYQSPSEKQAYIRSLAKVPQDQYDRNGFLKSIGVQRSFTYSRDERDIQKLLTQIDYKSEKDQPKALEILQKLSLAFITKTPKAFFSVSQVLEPLLTYKDKKKESWLNTPIPLALNSKVQPKTEPPEQIYAQTIVAKSQANKVTLPELPQFFQEIFNLALNFNQVQPFFSEPFHLGVPKPGESEPHYGSYAIAKTLGFTKEQSTRIATANYDIDLNRTPYGKTTAMPLSTPSRHFDLNRDDDQKGDTRFIWAKRHLEAAVQLAKKGHYEQAEKELGYGLHSIQDAFAHAHVSLSLHATSIDVPDSISYNPIGMQEATMASVGYLNAYLTQILAT